MISQSQQRFHQGLNWFFQQFQLKPGKPDIAASFQTLISVLGPLAIGVWLGNPIGSAIAILGAWFVGLVNVEGVYRQQAAGKLGALISITVMLFLANGVHGTLWLSALTTFLVMFCAGFIGVWGQAASAIGLTTSIAFVVALARFATASDGSAVLHQGALCLAGGLWSIALSLGIWQLRPYKPVIQSVANSYQALSQLADSAKGRVTDLDDRRNQLNRFLQTQDNFTQALMTARNRWAAAWTAQQATNQSANRLLILIEDTPSIASAIVSLVEQVVITSDHPLFRQLQPEIQQVMEQLSRVLQQMARAIATGKSSVHLGDLDRAIEALNNQQQTLHAQANPRLDPNPDLQLNPPKDYFAISNLSKISHTLMRLVDQIHAGVEQITTLQKEDNRKDSRSLLRQTTRSQSDSTRVLPSRFSKIPFRQSMASLIDPLRNNLTIHSVLFRHALRLAIVATIAELIASIFQIPRGYWMTLTAVVALKPNYGGTSQTTLQRVLGTVLGGVIGIAIVTFIHNSWVIGACLLLLIMAAMAVRPLSFSLFITLLTPAIILLLNVTSRGGWEIGVLRIADSLAGGILALLGSYLLFPRWERQQLPSQLATTIRANLAYFQQVVALYLHSDKGTATNAVAPLRRQAALENTNMTASAQRLLSDPRHVQGNVEPITTLIFYLRRFFNSVTAMAEHRQDVNQPYQCAELKQFADTIVQILENSADALRQGTLQPLPNLDRPLDAIHRHIEQLHLAQLNAHAKQFSPEDSPAENPTPLNPLIHPSRAIRESTPISASLDQIAYEIKNIHQAIGLFKLSY